MPLPGCTSFLATSLTNFTNCIVSVARLGGGALFHATRHKRVVMGGEGFRAMRHIASTGQKGRGRKLSTTTATAPHRAIARLRHILDINHLLTSCYCNTATTQRCGLERYERAGVGVVAMVSMAHAVGGRGFVCTGGGELGLRISWAGKSWKGQNLVTSEILKSSPPATA